MAKVPTCIMNMNASWAPRVSPDKQKRVATEHLEFGRIRFDHEQNGQGERTCYLNIKSVGRVLCVMFMSTSPGVLSNFGTVLVFNTPNFDLLLLFYGHKCVFDVMSSPLQGLNYRFRFFLMMYDQSRSRLFSSREWKTFWLWFWSRNHQNFHTILCQRGEWPK